MARFYKPKRDRAQTFADQLSTVDPSFGIVGPRGGKKALNALATFLASFGSKVARLTKTAKGKLLQQDATQDQLMRETAVDKLKQSSQRELKNAIERYDQGKIDSRALKNEMTGILKRQTLAAAIIGVRGVGNLTDNVLTAVKRQLAIQLAYLDGFMEDIQTRTITQRDRARADQYANSVWAISQTAARQFNLDTSGISGVQLEEMRKLGGAEHCDDCIEMSEHWEPIGTLPPIGQGSVCGMSCRCTMIVRPINEETKQVSQTTNDSPVIQDR